MERASRDRADTTAMEAGVYAHFSLRSVLASDPELCSGQYLPTGLLLLGLQ